MKRLKLAGALGAILLIEAWLAWHQAHEIARWRGQLLSVDDRVTIAAKLGDLRTRQRLLQAELDLSRRPAPQPMPNRPAPPRSMSRLEAAFADPQFQAALTSGQKAHLDRWYAPLFASLNLSPEQLDKFKNLLVERQTAKTEATFAANNAGITREGEPATYHQALEDAQKEVNTKIRELLGESRFAEYRHYQETNMLREAANTLQQRLSYTSAPLSPEQSRQLVEVWQKSMTAEQLHGLWTGPGAESGSGMLPWTLPLLPAEQFSSAEGILTDPQQLQAFREIQQTIDARYRLRAGGP